MYNTGDFSFRNCQTCMKAKNCHRNVKCQSSWYAPSTEIHTFSTSNLEHIFQRQDGQFCSQLFIILAVILYNCQNIHRKALRELLQRISIESNGIESNAKDDCHLLINTRFDYHALRIFKSTFNVRRSSVTYTQDQFFTFLYRHCVIIMFHFRVQKSIRLLFAVRLDFFNTS